MLINSWREKQFVTRCSRWFRREKPEQNEISWCDFNRALAHSGWLNLITRAAGLCCACSERQQMLWMSCGTQMLRPHTGRQDLLKTLPRCSEISVSMGHCSGKHRRTCGWELIPDPTTTESTAKYQLFSDIYQRCFCQKSSGYKNRANWVKS